MRLGERKTVCKRGEVSETKRLKKTDAKEQDKGIMGVVYFTYSCCILFRFSTCCIFTSYTHRFSSHMPSTDTCMQTHTCMDTHTHTTHVRLAHQRRRGQNQARGTWLKELRAASYFQVSWEGHIATHCNTLQHTAAHCIAP